MRWTAASMASAVRDGEVSPVELVEEALRRAEAWQPVTNAFSELRPDEALTEARHRAERVALGDDLGPLHGVPVAVKDLFDVAGWETTGCCRGYRGRIAARDADAVRRLRRAGAVIVGKTNQHELAAGATNLVSACGPTANPWDPTRITGGSSGGSGAAVAAGVVPLALGTDTGGSIRIPGSLCGVTGLKTTHGRLSLDGVMPLAPSLDTVGPLAAAAGDAALADAVLAGEGPGTGGLPDGLTVGVLGTEYVAFLHPEVQDLVTNAVAVLRDLAARTVAILGAPFDPELWARLAWAEFARHHGGLLEQPDAVLPPTRELLERGARVGDRKLAEARQRADVIREGFDRALSTADVLAAAATPFAAPMAGRDEVDVGGETLSVRAGAVSLLTRTVSLGGLPAVVVPVGWTSAGLPAGIQLIGRHGSEGLLLALAERFQAATDHHLKEPPAPGRDQVRGGPPA